MMPSIRWGALVAASLPLACAPAAPAPAPPPPAAPSASVVVAPAPPPPGLSPFAPLFRAVPDRARKTDDDMSSAVVAVRFGRGQFQHTTFQHRGLPACPLQREEGCGVFAIRVEGQAPEGSFWPPATALPAVSAPDGAIAAPHDWSTFASGRHGVYALRRGGGAVDFIDAQGKVSLFLRDDAARGWIYFHVVEHGSRVFLLTAGSEERGLGSWRLNEALAGGPQGPRRLGPAADLPMRRMSSEATAQSARAASRDEHAASLGVPLAVPLPDEKDRRDRWALVWLEIIPPPMHWPRSKPMDSATLRAMRKGKNSCSNPSRDIRDTSVTKRAHSTRFSGASIEGDSVLWSANDMGPDGVPPPIPRVERGRVVVPRPTGKAATGEGPEPWPEPQEEEGKPEARRDERVLALEFDPASKDGWVVVADGPRSLAQRFDPDGNPLGEPLVFSLEIEEGDLIHSGSKWLYFTRNSPHDLYNLTDRTPPVRVSSVEGEVALFATEQGPRLVWAEDRVLKTAPLEQGGKVGPEEKLDGEIPQGTSLEFLRLGDEPAVVVLSQRSPHLFWRPLTKQGSWTGLPLAYPGGEAGVPDFEPRYHRVKGDLVLAVDKGGETAWNWLRAGKSSVSKTPARNGLFSGPLLAGGQRLPEQPGRLLVDPAQRPLDGTCTHSVQTGPRSFVAACVEPTGKVEPGLQAGLRALYTAP